MLPFCIINRNRKLVTDTTETLIIINTLKNFKFLITIIFRHFLNCLFNMHNYNTVPNTFKFLSGTGNNATKVSFLIYRRSQIKIKLQLVKLSCKFSRSFSISLSRLNSFLLCLFKLNY